MTDTPLRQLILTLTLTLILILYRNPIPNPKLTHTSYKTLIFSANNVPFATGNKRITEDVSRIKMSMILCFKRG